MNRKFFKYAKPNAAFIPQIFQEIIAGRKNSFQANSSYLPERSTLAQFSKVICNYSLLRIHKSVFLLFSI